MFLNKFLSIGFYGHKSRLCIKLIFVGLQRDFSRNVSRKFKGVKRTYNGYVERIYYLSITSIFLKNFSTVERLPKWYLENVLKDISEAKCVNYYKSLSLRFDSLKLELLRQNEFYSKKNYSVFKCGNLKILCRTYRGQHFSQLFWVHLRTQVNAVVFPELI